MHWLICYDISDAKNRDKALRLLRQYSGSYQKSGFELLHCSTQELQKFCTLLAPLIGEHDSLLITRLQQESPHWQLGSKTTLQNFLIFS